MSQYGVLAGAEKGLDLQILFDPFKEQLNLPAGLVDLSNCRCSELKIICKESQGLFPFFIVVSDEPEFFGVFGFSQRPLQGADGKQRFLRGC